VACALACAPGPAQGTEDDAIVTYRCPGNNYKNTLSPAEAEALGCKKLEGGPIKLVPPGTTPPVALGSSWTFLVRSQTGEAYEMSADRYYPAPDGARLWVRSKTLPGAKPKYASSMALYEVDCRGSRLRVLQSATYDDRGQSLEKWDSPTPWSTPFPESIGETVMTSACQMRATAARGTAAKRR
jgi:hypothetical protein